MQNSPQFVIAYYAILRADAVVVPVNPMNLTEELKHYASDARGRSIAVCRAGTAAAHRAAARDAEPGAHHRPPITPTTSDPPPTCRCRISSSCPAGVRARHRRPGATRWRPRACRDRTLAGPDDLAALPYTSGTTGKPKGCMHTHRTLMGTIALAGVWARGSATTLSSRVVPFFHITGMQMLMNGSIYLGAEHRGDDALGPRTRAETDRAPPGDELDQYPDHGDRPVRQPQFQVRQPGEPARHFRRRRGHARSRGQAPVRSDRTASSPKATASPRPPRPRTAITRAGPSGSAWAFRCAIPKRASSIRTRCRNWGRARPARSSPPARRSSPATGTSPRPRRGRFIEHRRQALLPHRRPRALRRGRLFFHRRPPEAHDQRLGLQGLAGRGGGDDVSRIRTSRRSASSARRTPTAARR